MFCNQCQEASRGTGCISVGVCGKTHEVSDLQDLLIYVAKGISIYANIGRKNGISDDETDFFVMNSLFRTITNVNFDEQSIINSILKGMEIRNRLRQKIETSGIDIPVAIHESATWDGSSVRDLIDKASTVGIAPSTNEDIKSLRELLLFGVKGLAAYTEHAWNLGKTNNELFAFMQKSLEAITDDTLTADDYIKLVMEAGKYGVEAMALLDASNTGRYGNPEITKVNIGVRNNPGILISGHDLRDLEDLLVQTRGAGVDVYTHSEMLPAHYYPAFKKYDNLAGNYGGAWWNQQADFETFNGPILFTTNCLVPPNGNTTYKSRVYTTGAVSCDGMKHIADRMENGMKDFSEVIEHAKKCAPPIEIETGEIVGGFAHEQVLALADKVIDAVNTGAIKKFVVMAGCDGRMKSREYYTEFAEKLPNDAVILTAGCAKYRYNKLPLGDIGGIPRVLDAGQCNDSYSLAVIALKLKEVFGLDDINKLPIVYNIAWYEQKAVIVLLALLYLGVRNIHLGPTLPPFLSANVAKILVDVFGIGGITDAENDVNLMLN